MIKILKNTYIIAGIIVFLLLFVIGVIWLDFPWTESLLASLVLTIVGIGTIWWQRHGL